VLVLIKQLKGNENPSALDVAKSAVNSAADTIVNMSVLSGLNSLVSGYQGKTWTDKVEGVTKGTLGSFVPTALNQVRQLSDNTARTTYESYIYLGEMLTRAKNRIPSSEKSLPPAYDTLGNQRENYQNGSNNAFNVLLNPSFVSKYEPTPEEKFVIDYIDKTGDKKPAPYLVDKKLDGKKLTADNTQNYQRIMGLETQKGFQRVIPNLQGQTNYEQVSKILRKVLRDAGKTAREEIRADMSK
jgi:hypothetical protein